MPFFEFSGLGKVAHYVQFIQTHWWVSFKDALMTVFLYLAVGLSVKNIYWGRKFGNKRLLILLVLAGLWSIFVEYHAVQVAHRWAYAPSMPLLPVLGVGLWPLLQMLIIPPLAIFLARNQLKY
jgi:hypothetical protein